MSNQYLFNKKLVTGNPLIRGGMLFKWLSIGPNKYYKLQKALFVINRTTVDLVFKSLAEDIVISIANEMLLEEFDFKKTCKNYTQLEPKIENSSKNEIDRDIIESLMRREYCFPIEFIYGLENKMLKDDMVRRLRIGRGVINTNELVTQFRIQ